MNETDIQKSSFSINNGTRIPKNAFWANKRS